MSKKRKLRDYVWMTPALLALLALPLSIWVERKVAQDLENGLRTQLETTRDVTAQVLREWSAAQLRLARLADGAPAIQEPALSLANAPGMLGPKELEARPEQQELRNRLGSILRQWEFDGYYLWVDGRVLAAWRPDQVGRTVAPEDLGFREVPAPGRAVQSPPKHFELPTDDPSEEFFWVAVGLPVAGKQAFLSFRISAARSFSRLFAHAAFGRTGESYAIGADGTFLTEPRFLETLKGSGAVSRQPEAFRLLKVQDPGEELVSGTAYPKGRLPLTLAARQIVAKEAGSNVEGYTDYRGKKVIGAWRWFPEFGLGLVTELDQEEALEPLRTPRALSRIVMIALAVLSVAFYVGGRVLQRIAAKAQKAQRLGQYVLERKIGEGGMGAVYRAKHALLRRPTAVKLMRAEAGDERSFARFEREVQATAELSHPNTIQIYDYGHTEAGVFYYAMEYLEGLSLEGLVRRAGPLPEGRAVHFLVQILGALSEAHERGLIHRDIKPANIMVCRRGGVPDFIKVLDFGLVKDSRDEGGVAVTQADAITGTPQYIAPETIVSAENVSALSDLYAVGCVAYFLLTGRVPFEGTTLIAVLSQHMSLSPAPFSAATVNSIHPELETLVFACLEKDPARRPASSRILRESLIALAANAGLSWSTEEAESYWRENPPVSAAASTIESGDTLAIELRDRSGIKSGSASATQVLRREVG